MQNRNTKTHGKAPMQNLSQREKAMKSGRSAQPLHAPIDVENRQPPVYANLQMLFLVGLPLLLIVALFANIPHLWLAFNFISILALMFAWLKQAFYPPARIVLTVVYIMLISVSLFWLLINPPKSAPAETGGTPAAAAIRPAALPLPNDVLSNPATASPAPTEFIDVSSAQKRLEAFMVEWRNVNYAKMHEYCLPAWVKEQENPEQAMFHLRANRSVENFEILEMTGNETDQSRTANMHVVINKNNGSPAQTHLFQVLMVKSAGEWYVDPKSLGTLAIIDDGVENNRRAIATIVPTPKPDENTLLYYNDRGGQLYHLDSQCPSIKPEFLPLTHSFRYAEVNNAPYNKLDACGTCRAPGR